MEALGVSWKEVDCRGYWHSLELKDNEITFTTETAWTPVYEVFDLICKKFPSIRHYYCAEETASGVYETNDREGKYQRTEKYYFIALNSKGEVDSGYVDELQSALDGINEIIGCEAQSIEDVCRINNELMEQESDAYCSILELRVV